MLSQVKKLLYKYDFFYTTELLRYKKEPEYRTLFGGVLSLIIIIALIATFYNKLIDTLDIPRMTTAQIDLVGDFPIIRLMMIV